MHAKHGNFVDADAPAAIKLAQNILNHV